MLFYLNRVSSWQKAKTTVAWIRRAIVNLQQTVVCKTTFEGPTETHPSKSAAKSPNVQQKLLLPLSVQELVQAEQAILSCVQRHYFGPEVETLKNLNGNLNKFEDRYAARQRNDKLRKASCLRKLDPFIDENGLVRVGVRIRRAAFPLALKHPCILPKRSHITDLIIEHFHEKVTCHQGRGITHNAVRQAGYWIVNGRSTVTRAISKCVICRRFRGRLLTQKMSDLPEERVAETAPFLYTGMDVFGPFYIKEGRKTLKRYGLLFTCLASRAVHLETLNSMEADSFISALRRFINRRGKVRELRSDRGTNFVGARNELADALQELDRDRVQDFLRTKDCDWICFNFNVPASSHMGGVWERLIRTVRSVLSILLQEQGSQLDDEALRTLMTEVENVINSRPLTVENLSEPGFPEPITPNHLLTSKTEIVLPPPGSFERVDLYSRKRWRRVQFMANQFWFRWRRECSPLLYTRQKWNMPQRDCKVGDIVMLQDNPGSF